MKTIKICFMIFPLTAIFLMGCAGTPELTTTSANNIKIDGNAEDWSTNLKYLKDENVALGVSNDKNYFYLCLTTSDLGRVMPMFAEGFTVKLENEKTDSSIGIKYPLHNIVNEANIMINPDASREHGREMMLKKFIGEQNEIRILNKDNFPVTVISTSDSSGLTTRIGYNNGQFVYELRVPINNINNEKYYLPVSPGEKLSLKFKTENPERKGFGGRRGGDMMGPGGMGRGSGGYGNERPEGGERPSFNPINFDVEVTMR